MFVAVLRISRPCAVYEYLATSYTTLMQNSNDFSQDVETAAIFLQKFILVNKRRKEKNFSHLHSDVLAEVSAALQ